MIRIQNLSKRFGNIQALDGVTLTFPPGITALIGANGAGKTTLIKIACGVLLPDGGEVLYDGRSLHQARRRLVRSIGVVFENAENVYGYLPVWANLRFFATLWDLPAPWSADARTLLQRLGLWDRRRSPVNDLSRGNKQKVAIVMALMKRPRYLFLDEPTLGLDVMASAEVEALLQTWVREQGCTAVLTTHRMDLAWRLADRFVFLKGGRGVWEGAREDLRKLPLWRRTYRVMSRRDHRVHQHTLDASTLSETLTRLTRAGHTILEVRLEETRLDDVVRALLREEETS
ncbi:MAG: ABC transporter ATP-binding protein [Candidatus Hydrothermae bacterium]|nr:ABC transporter ATP-binding protein [Candidatus Hydrothermae bacterium]